MKPGRTTDWCAPAHAGVLAQRIVDHWREQGATVNVRVEITGGKTPLAVIRSDLIRGLPRP
jgi:hypothetical protein